MLVNGRTIASPGSAGNVSDWIQRQMKDPGENTGASETANREDERLDMNTTMTEASIAALQARAIDPADEMTHRFLMPAGTALPIPFHPMQHDGPGLLMAWRGPDGTLAGTQYRPDAPRKTDESGKVKKYVFPKGQAVTFGWINVPKHADTPVLVVEGLLKALSVAQAVGGSVGVVAVPSCRISKDADFSWSSGRDVYVCLDADIMTNHGVWHGARFLNGGLGRAGAKKVRFVLVPALPGDPKAGIDDVLGATEPGERFDLMQRMIGDARTLPPSPAPEDARVIPGPDYPFPAAEFLLRDFVDSEGNPILINRDGVFHQHDGRRWVERTETQVYDTLNRVLSRAYYTKQDKEGETRTLPWNPKIPTVKEVVRALTTLTNVSVDLGGDVVDNVWLPVDDAPAHPLHGQPVISFRNGLVSVKGDRRIYPHTPQWFSQTCVPYDFDPGAPAPVEWFKFLGSQWADHPDTIEALQEWFGYVLSGDVDRHKYLQLNGAPRSGKSVIISVLTAMIGEANHEGISVTDLGRNFGLERLVGKTLATDGDARVGKADRHAILTNFLKITGQDAITVDRKYRRSWSGKLATRFVIATNDPMQFPDASGALAKRTLLLRTTTSFFGREDRSILGKITRRELAGIVNWALAGYDRLTEQGDFTKPALSARMEETVNRSNSPLSAFLDDWCELDAGSTVSKESLFDCYKQWCAANGQDHTLTQVQFATQLYAVGGNIEECKPRVNGKQVRSFRGVRIVAPLTPGVGYSDPDVPESESESESETAEPVAAPVQPSGAAERAPEGLSDVVPTQTLSEPAKVRHVAAEGVDPAGNDDVSSLFRHEPDTVEDPFMKGFDF